ncbi:MAG: Uma2 family endonuclease [Candidatus Thermofonsia Clade 3 bacterium]|uniref:Uma2 family endonuclease n=2 Tax=Candidatus Thermofonsia Clade 3 TaxID=2364209 RepID=A0A2M8QAJ2_9CHLR|nr:MAG: Uma2 family endonuclease [Candidatus Thermofonsia Clade 3 bacterium]
MGAAYSGHPGRAVLIGVQLHRRRPARCAGSAVEDVTMTLGFNDETDTVKEPAWEVAYLFPAQGEWTEEDYFALPDNTRLELAAGRLERFQRIVAFLYRLLLSFIGQRYPGAEALFASLPIRLGPNTLREPDIVLMLPEHRHRIHEQYWEKPDMVIEVVLPKNRATDLRDKRREYAQAGIPECWIVDPQSKTVTVLKLSGETYVVHGAYGYGDIAESALLDGFRVDSRRHLARRN